MTNGKRKSGKRFRNAIKFANRVKGVHTGLHSKTKWVKRG